MATNLALVSLTDNVKRITVDVKRIQKAYDSLQNKSTKYALDHQALLMAYKEVLAVYVRHLKAAQQSFAPDATPDEPREEHEYNAWDDDPGLW